MALRRLRPCLIPSLLLAAAALSAPAEAAPLLRVEGRHFKDAAGRTVVLRGVNVAGNSKVPPFTAASDPAIFEPLPGWGLNVVRLLFTWEAYEPEKGKYSEAYLDYYAAAAGAASEQGLHVIVDFHQDAFSRYSIDGCGEGFPKWALPASVTPETPDNGPACSSWGIKMQSDADMKASWTAFHADEGGVKGRYLAMLESVSARLAAEPGVIGYDIMNEPWGDEVAELGPFYEEAAAALRKASPDAILFISPHALSSAGIQTKLTRPSFDNIAYSPHFYDASVILFDSWSGVLPDEPFKNMNGKAEEWGVPLFLGEFGGPGPAEDVGPYMDVLYQRLDERLSSGAQWVYTPGWTEAAKDGWNTEDFSIVDDKGGLRPSFRPRPYPQAIAGEPTTFRLTEAKAAADRVIELEWENEPEAGFTDLFVPRQAFFATESVAVEATGEGLVCLLGPSHVLCASPSAGPMRIRVKKASGSAPEPARCGLVGIEMLALWPLLLVARRRRRARRVDS